MKQSLTLRLGQNLTMTPALQQAIKLLQLSTLDLTQEIQQALDSNLMLERVEDGEALPEGEEASADIPDDIPAELPVDADWEDIYDGATHGGGTVDESLWEYRQASIQPPPSLSRHLLDQLALESLDDPERAIAEHIVDALDEDGYISSWPELVEQIGNGIDATPQDAESVLERIQALDPSGVAARNLAECLTLQLKQLPGDTPGIETALEIVSRHLVLLAGRDYAALARATGLDEPLLDTACTLIRALQPRPGAPFYHQEANYITPEVFVEKRRGRWVVSLNSEITPRLRINPYYRSLVRRADKSEDQVCLKQHLQEARFFLSSLRSRNETLLRVSQAIVEQQQAFLEYGEEAMKPLVLRDVAEQVGVHESTVSRATAHKYMQCPRGLFELKYFFSSGVSTTTGGSASAVAIQAMIKRLVDEEPPEKPYSDSKIAKLLLEKGVKVARRTVAKYRESQHIPPSSERKQLA